MGGSLLASARLGHTPGKATLGIDQTDDESFVMVDHGALSYELLHFRRLFGPACRYGPFGLLRYKATRLQGYKAALFKGDV
jgi:hypothetical protein